MDSLAHTQKLFARIEAEISDFVQILSKIAMDSSHLPTLRSKAIQELGHLFATAREIGGPLFRDVEILNADFHRFLTAKDGLKKLIEDAMRIKHEVRAL